MLDLMTEQIAEFAQYVRLVSCAPEHNRQRFYVFNWQRSLCGERVLVCTWGRIGTLGRSRVIHFSDNAPVATSLQRLINRRLRGAMT